MRLALSVLVMTVALIDPVFASISQLETASEMGQICQGLARAQVSGEGEVLVAPTNDSATCWGAFIALQGLATLTWKGTGRPIVPICAAPSSTRIELVRTFVAYLASHPDQAAAPFMDVAVQALLNAYPCKSWLEP